MTQKTNRWEVLLMVGLMLVLAVGLWGTSGSGMRLGAQVLAASAPAVTGGGGNEPGTIVTTGTGTGKAMPAVIGTGTPGTVTFWTDTDTLSGDLDFCWNNTNKRLGIGTASPAAKLDVVGDAVVSGKVGIGTTSPQRPLHLVGNVCQFERAQDSAGFIIKRTSDNRWVLGANETEALGQGFVISTYPEGAGSSTPRLLVTTGGKVGIGTTTPTLGKLQVESDSGDAVYGRYNGGNYGYLGSSNFGVYGCSSTGGVSGVRGEGTGIIMGVSGSSTEGAGVVGFYGTGTASYMSGNGVYGKNTDSQNYGYLGGSDYGVYGSASAGEDYAGYFQGNVHVTGTLTVGPSPRVSMGRIFKTGDEEIISTGGGTRILYWDETNGDIEITNTSGDYCDYWWQSQNGATTTGGSGTIATGLSNQVIISETNTNFRGFEVHFGQADGTAGWCSVWLQYANGQLVGHYINY